METLKTLRVSSWTIAEEHEIKKKETLGNNICISMDLGPLHVSSFPTESSKCSQHLQKDFLSLSKILHISVLQRNLSHVPPHLFTKDRYSRDGTGCKNLYAPKRIVGQNLEKGTVMLMVCETRGKKNYLSLHIRYPMFSKDTLGRNVSSMQSII